MARWIDAVNDGEDISEDALRQLKTSVLIYPKCRELLTERGKRILRGKESLDGPPGS